MPRRRRPPTGAGNQGGYQPGANAGGNVPQPPAAPTGMQYGAHQASIAAQQAMPLPQTQSASAAPPVPASPGGGGALAQALAQAQAMAPPQGGLLAPSNRPSEPVTAGLPIGPGPGPEALGGMANMNASGLAELRAVYQLFPTEEIRQIIERWETDRAQP